MEGHAEGAGYDFSQIVYNASPAASINSNLLLSQDAANVILGGNWRMPSSAEFQELYDNCTSEWTTINGVAGRLFTSRVNGESIFFPAAGYYDSTSLQRRGSLGFYWSSTYIDMTQANRMDFWDSQVEAQNSGSRRVGLNIRAVMNQ